NVYAPDLFLADALRFLADNQSRPFFLYFATTVPHANNERTKATGEGNEVPSDAPYSEEDWPRPEKNKAAMITRLDADVGKLLADGLRPGGGSGPPGPGRDFVGPDHHRQGGAEEP